MQSKQSGRLKAATTVALASLLGGGAGALVTKSTFQANPTVHVQAAVDPGNVPLTYSPIVKRTAPAVVNISTSKVVKASMRTPNRRGQQQIPPQLREFFGFDMPQPQDRRESALGSGVIVDPQGYILTNNHVVEGATEVKVALSDRREFDAKVVGGDKATDIAVLKITGTGFPTLPVSDSSKVEVGDVALAIGNPFGIGQTVTMGIIGATGRSGLGIEGYEDFIQTDAAINPGNSGGALINARGELIAINTAILAGGGSGGNQGIGFAIPINMAREVMDQLVKKGKVTRGYIGVQPQTVDPALARTFSLPDRASGVALTEVQPDTPGAKAGLQTGDVVIAINGEPVTDSNSFRLRVSRMAPGTTVQLKLLRDGKERTIPVTLGTFPEDRIARNGEPGADRETTGSLSGISVEAITPQLSQELQLPRGTRGVIVTEVEPSSNAARAGLRERDIIESVNRQPVTSEADFQRLLKQGEGKPILLLVNKGGASRFVVVDPQK